VAKENPNPYNDNKRKIYKIMFLKRVLLERAKPLAPPSRPLLPGRFLCQRLLAAQPDLLRQDAGDLLYLDVTGVISTPWNPL
jgi:hypothetical protein